MVVKAAVKKEPKYFSPYLPVIDSEALDELELPQSAGQVDLVG